MSKVKLLFGIEFWDFLEDSIKKSKKHIFIFSAYAKQEDIQYLVSLIPNNIPYLIVVRDDISKIEIPNLIYVNKDRFHAKLYIIDDIIIIGSQNIYKVIKIPLEEKTGEISVAFSTSDSVNIIYQSLLIVLKDEYELYFENKIKLFESEFYQYDYGEPSHSNIWLNFFREYKVESFLNIKSGKCPSCGNELNIKENEFHKIWCPHYKEAISVDECREWNACKYCIGPNKIVEPNILYECNKCNFKIGYMIHELGKAPYWSWEELSFCNTTEELESFLKLYFYLVDKIGEKNTNELLMSLGIIGNLSQLDLSKRYYEIQDIV